MIFLKTGLLYFTFSNFPENFTLLYFTFSNFPENGFTLFYFQQVMICIDFFVLVINWYDVVQIYIDFVLIIEESILKLAKMENSLKSKIVGMDFSRHISNSALLE